MSKYLVREAIADQAEIHESVKAPHEVDRTFELPKGIYAATVGCYLAFLMIMAVGFSSPGLIIPMAIFAVFIIAGFSVPAIWAVLSPDETSKAMSRTEFRRSGISTFTGHLKSGEATVQVLILPVLIVGWALTVVTIAAIVS